MKKNILIRHELPQEISLGGIILTAPKHPKIRKGVVLQIGSEVTDVKVGDCVLFDPVGYEMEYQGQPAMIVEEKHIQSIFEL